MFSLLQCPIPTPRAIWGPSWALKKTIHNDSPDKRANNTSPRGIRSKWYVMNRCVAYWPGHRILHYVDHPSAKSES